MGKIVSHLKEKEEFKILCTIHDDWAGKPNKTSVCEECLAKAIDDFDHMYYEGIPLRVIIRRPAP